MTTHEREEFALLCLKTDQTQKFAIAVNCPLSQAQQSALERLQLRDWIRLIDVAAIAAVPPGVLMRVFRVMPAALQWLHHIPLEDRPS